MMKEKLSIIVPFFNEEENVNAFFKKLLPVLDSLPHISEIIAVDDGSVDSTPQLLAAVAERDSRIQVVSFVRNYGQTAALQAGFDHSSGHIIIALDSDLQNNPEDIPALLAKYEEGYDVVSGWRKYRRDSKIRVLPSKIANWLISKISGVKLHDYGCTLKLYRRDVMKSIRLYGEMHRFIPIYASWYGAKIVEIPVQHQERKFGSSHYGFNRIIKVLLDLCLIVFLDRYLTRPIYIFGGVSFFFLCITGITFLWALYLKLFTEISFIQTPLILISVMTFCLSIISLILGFLAEVISRTYFESQSKKSYNIKKKAIDA